MTVPAVTTTEVVLPLVTDDKDYLVVIEVKATRRVDLGPGRYVSETANHTSQTTLTKSELNTLLFQLQPISAA